MLSQLRNRMVMNLCVNCRPSPPNYDLIIVVSIHAGSLKIPASCARPAGANAIRQLAYMHCLLAIKFSYWRIYVRSYHISFFKFRRRILIASRKFCPPWCISIATVCGYTCFPVLPRNYQQTEGNSSEVE